MSGRGSQRLCGKRPSSGLWAPQVRCLGAEGECSGTSDRHRRGPLLGGHAAGGGRGRGAGPSVLGGQCCREKSVCPARWGQDALPLVLQAAQQKRLLTGRCWLSLNTADKRLGLKCFYHFLHATGQSHGSNLSQRHLFFTGVGNSHPWVRDPGMELPGGTWRHGVSFRDDLGAESEAPCGFALGGSLSPRGSWVGVSGEETRVWTKKCSPDGKCLKASGPVLPGGYLSDSSFTAGREKGTLALGPSTWQKASFPSGDPAPTAAAS